MFHLCFIRGYPPYPFSTWPLAAAVRAALQDAPLKRRPARSPDAAELSETIGLRIVGGKLRGSKLAYSGDIRTRPMKDRLREAVREIAIVAVA